MLKIRWLLADGLAWLNANLEESLTAFRYENWNRIRQKDSSLCLSLFLSYQMNHNKLHLTMNQSNFVDELKPWGRGVFKYSVKDIPGSNLLCKRANNIYQMSMTTWHFQNRCRVDSTALWQREHLEHIWNPRRCNNSSNRIWLQRTFQVVMLMRG